MQPVQEMPQLNVQLVRLATPIWQGIIRARSTVLELIGGGIQTTLVRVATEIVPLVMEEIQISASPVLIRQKSRRTTRAKEPVLVVLRTNSRPT